MLTSIVNCTCLLAAGSQSLFTHSVYNCVSLLLAGHTVDKSRQGETAKTNANWILKRSISHRKEMN